MSGAMSREARQAEVLRLRLEDKPDAEIAELLGVSKGLVRHDAFMLRKRGAPLPLLQASTAPLPFRGGHRDERYRMTRKRLPREVAMELVAVGGPLLPGCLTVGAELALLRRGGRP